MFALNRQEQVGAGDMRHKERVAAKVYGVTKADRACHHQHGHATQSHLIPQPAEPVTLQPLGIDWRHFNLSKSIAPAVRRHQLISIVQCIAVYVVHCQKPIAALPQGRRAIRSRAEHQGPVRPRQTACHHS